MVVRGSQHYAYRMKRADSSRDGGEWSTAASFLPARVSLPTVRRASLDCRGCPLWEHATQTVFGEGEVGARLLFVGEQPGNDEDRSGRPFVGPAGRLLDEALEEAGIDRGDTYVTNVVKHFKWEAKGRRRLHRKPNSREIGACLPWLEVEIELVKPGALVCLGATAAQAVFGKQFRVSEERGRELPSRFHPRATATIHPSALLRLPETADHDAEHARFVADLRFASGLVPRRS